MPASQAFTRTWQVGRHTCTLSAPKPIAGQLQCAVIEWAPHEPDKLNAVELAAYRAGRNAAVADMAADLGISVAIVDL